MGILSGIKLKNILGRVGLGLLDIVGLGTIKSNIESNHKADKLGNKTGFGSIDWIRLSTFILVAGVLLAVIFDKIDMETAEKLIKLLK